MYILWPTTEWKRRYNINEKHIGTYTKSKPKIGIYPLYYDVKMPLFVVQILLRKRGTPMADLQRQYLVPSGRVDPAQDGRRRFQTSDRHRHVRVVHAARRGRCRTIAVPGPSWQHTRAAVLLEALLRPGPEERYGIHWSKQPLQGDRRQRIYMSKCVSGWFRQRHQWWVSLLLYQRIVRRRLWSVGSHRVSTDLKTSDICTHSCPVFHHLLSPPRTWTQRKTIYTFFKYNHFIDILTILYYYYLCDLRLNGNVFLNYKSNDRLF